jgi:hypothetical protein
MVGVKNELLFNKPAFCPVLFLVFEVKGSKPSLGLDEKSLEER